MRFLSVAAMNHVVSINESSILSIITFLGELQFHIGELSRNISELVLDLEMVFTVGIQLSDMSGNRMAISSPVTEWSVN